MNGPFFWRLLLAHVAADFPLQPDALITYKKRVEGVAMHAGVFAVVAAMATGEYLKVSAVAFALVAIIVFHGIVDYGKSYIVKRLKRDSLWLFLADQAVHVASMFAVAHFLRLRVIHAAPIYAPLTIAILAAWAVPIVLELARSEFSKEHPEPRSSMAKPYGKIGMLERVGFFFAGSLTGWFLLCCLIAVPRIIGWIKGKKVDLIPVSWAMAAVLGIIVKLTL